MQLPSLKIVSFTYWLIRLRWYAIVGIIIAINTAKYFLGITIWEFPVYCIVLFLIVLNILSYSFLRYLQSFSILKKLKASQL